MVNQVVFKDPDDVRIEPLDWTLGLNSTDTIATSTWTVPSGVTKISDGIVSGALKTYITISGGTAGTDYVLTNRITTTLGETMDESCTLRVKNSTQG